MYSQNPRYIKSIVIDLFLYFFVSSKQKNIFALTKRLQYTTKISEKSSRDLIYDNRQK